MIGLSTISCHDGWFLSEILSKDLPHSQERLSLVEDYETRLRDLAKKDEVGLESPENSLTAMADSAALETHHIEAAETIHSPDQLDASRTVELESECLALKQQLQRVEEVSSDILFNRRIFSVWKT